MCNEGNENGNSCGALSTVVQLAPGEHCEFAFLVGMKEEPEVAEILASYALPEQVCGKELQQLTDYWHGS